MDLKWLVSALQNFTATLLLTQSVIEEWLTHNGMLVVKLFSALDAQMQARSEGEEEGGGLPPCRLKQIHFALNKKHVFFDAMP